MGRTLLRIVDSNASLLVLLLANFFLLQLIDDPRWGVLGSTLLAAVALVVAISDPDAGTTITRRHALSIAACVALAPLVFFVNSASSSSGSSSPSCTWPWTSFATALSSPSRASMRSPSSSTSASLR